MAEEAIYLSALIDHYCMPYKGLPGKRKETIGVCLKDAKERKRKGKAIQDKDTESTAKV